MVFIKCHTKPWGNSLGIIVPRRIVREHNIKPHEEIIVDIRGKEANVLRELFGSGKFSRPTEEILREARRELESRY